MSSYDEEFEPDDTPDEEVSSDAERSLASSLAGSSPASIAGSDAHKSHTSLGLDESASEAGRKPSRVSLKVSTAINAGRSQAHLEDQEDKESSSQGSRCSEADEEQSPKGGAKHTRKSSERLSPKQEKGTKAQPSPGDKKAPARLVDPNAWKAKHPDCPQPHRVTRLLHQPQVLGDTPGPAYYPDIAPCKPRAPGAVVLLEPRFASPWERLGASPGPLYNVDGKATWDRPVSIPRETRFRYFEGGPAPTDYMPDHNVVKRTIPGAKILQAPRPVVEPIPRKAPQIGESKDGNPSPAAKQKKRAKRILGGPLDPAAPCTFGTAHAKLPKSSRTPGPGAYYKAPEVGQKGVGAVLFKTGRDTGGSSKEDYEAGVGMYTPNYEAVKPRAPAPMCYLSST